MMCKTCDSPSLIMLIDHQLSIISHLPSAAYQPSAMSYLPVVMIAPTHIAFGLLAASFLGLVSGNSLGPEAFALAAFGALLPDVDTTTSTIGRLLYPLAAFIERRFGHRSITHSLVGLLIAASLAYGLWLIADSFHLPFAISHRPSAIGYFAFVTGYASHLLADSMNKAGIPLFWPNLNYQAVLPGNEAYRIRVGSTAEFVLLAILVPITALTVPLSQISLTTALHYLIRNVNSAVSDYQAWAGQYLVWVELEGRHNLSQKPVQGVFEAIGTAGQNAIVIRDGQGDIYAAGNSRDDQIYVHRIRAVQGIPIRTEIQEVRLADQLLGDLFTYFPTAVLEQRSRGAEEQGSSNARSRGPSSGLEMESLPHDRALGAEASTSAPLEVWIEGWFVTPSQPVLIDDVGEFNRSRRAQGVAGESLFEIRYFTPEDLASLQDIYVTRAHFILRAVYPVPEGTGAKEAQ